MRSFVPVVLLAFALPACVTAPPPAEPPPTTARFDAIGFFTGESRGRGRLKVALRATVPVRVESRGRVDADGVLVLDQSIEQDAEPPRQRRWRLREVAPGRYAGTLTDATGPVTGEASAGRLHLAFTMKGGLRVDQWLTLAADGRSAANLLRVRKFGVTIARLDETIRRAD